MRFVPHGTYDKFVRKMTILSKKDIFFIAMQHEMQHGI